MKKNLSIFGLIVLGFLLLPLGNKGQAGDFVTLQRENLIDPSLKGKIRKGLDFLAKNQNDTKDGSFSKNYKLATTALAGLAFLSYSGSGYKRGPYGENIARALYYILNMAKDKNGKIKNNIKGVGLWIHDGENQGRMHAHCYATLFLAEVYGTLRSIRMEAQVKSALKGAVKLLVNSQTSRGGWGYYYRGEPNDNEDEASITICVIQSLRAARNAGIEVPASTIHNAIGYVKKCMKKDGSVRYSLARGMQRTSFEITAAAISTLNSAGVYRSHELDKGLLYLRKAIDEERRSGSGKADGAAQNWYFYGNFYAAQAMYQAGDLYWKPWYRDAKASLLEKQKDDGRWTNKRFGNAYATAMALLILQIPFQNLPIFQR